MLYFISDRDGFRCIWAQRLNPATKRPEAAAFPLHHFHGAKRSLSPSHGRVGLSIARDKIALAVDELTGNIWMMQPRDN